jgi:hypothetical protein
MNVWILQSGVVVICILDLDGLASLPLVEVSQNFKGTANLFGFAQFVWVWFIRCGTFQAKEKSLEGKRTITQGKM